MPPLPHHRAYGSVPRRFGGLSGCHRLQGEQPHVWGRDPLHEVGGRRRAFGAGCRRGHFDLLPAPTHGFTGAGCREGQFPLVWRSRRGHEIPVLLALSFNPLAGDRSGLQPAGRPTTPSADFCAAVRPPCRWPQSRRTRRRSPGVSPAAFLAAPPDLQPWPLMDSRLAARSIPASDPIPVRRVAISLHASFRRSLAVPPLRFARTSPPSGCTGDFHPQAAGPAQYTAWPCGPPPPAAAGFDRAGPSTPRSTIGMKDADLLFPSRSMDCTGLPVH